MKDIFEIIKLRDSTRLFESKPIDSEVLKHIVEAAIYAPSGKNVQPWRFRIIRDKQLIVTISNHSKYNRWLKSADSLIVMYLDKQISYDEEKDLISVGAAIQNIILCATSIEIGSCVIGEFVKDSKEIDSVVGVASDLYKHVGIIALGYKRIKKASIKKKDINKFII